MELSFTLETELEKKTAADSEWREGVVWGKLRSGHMEGPIMYHTADMLANKDHQFPLVKERSYLRLNALLRILAVALLMFGMQVLVPAVLT